MSIPLACVAVFGQERIWGSLVSIHNEHSQWTFTMNIHERSGSIKRSRWAPLVAGHQVCRLDQHDKMSDWSINLIQPGSVLNLKFSGKQNLLSKWSFSPGFLTPEWKLNPLYFSDNFHDEIASWSSWLEFSSGSVHLGAPRSPRRKASGSSTNSIRRSRSVKSKTRQIDQVKPKTKMKTKMKSRMENSYKDRSLSRNCGCSQFLMF